MIIAIFIEVTYLYVNYNNLNIDYIKFLFEKLFEIEYHNHFCSQVYINTHVIPKVFLTNNYQNERGNSVIVIQFLKQYFEYFTLMN